MFYAELNKEESLVHGIMACNKLSYTKLKTSEREGIKNEILANSQTEASIGMASALILVKAYANWLLVEVNQICYGGIVRTIALGFTEGISSWKVEALCTYQPLVVPVGRSTLGRLFNVLGATIDAYMGIDELPTYSERQVSFNQYEAEHTTHIKHKIELNSSEDFINIIKICTEEEKEQTQQKNKKWRDLIKKMSTLAQTIKIETIGLIGIMGVGSEIIKTRGSEVMSF